MGWVVWMMLLVAKCMQYDRQEPQPFFSSIDLPHLYQILFISNKQKEKKKYGIGLYMYICIYLYLFCLTHPPHPIPSQTWFLFSFFFWCLYIYFFGPFSIFFSSEYSLSTSRITPLSVSLQIYFFFGGSLYLHTLIENCLFSRPGLTLLTWSIDRFGLLLPCAPSLFLVQQHIYTHIHPREKKKRFFFFK